MDNFSIGYSVDDSQLVNKVGEDVKIVQQLDKAVQGASSTFKQFDKAQEGTVHTIIGAKKQMAQMKKQILDLTLTYQNLSDTEKKGEFGKQLEKKLSELKIKMAEFTDTMGDANEEIKNLASDTQFTDGMNLMVGTLGNVSSAMVALGGDSEHLKEVLADIAKIQTTVKAVESLTKAFQKQNLVLLKNPYVLAATAIAALGVAIYKYTTTLSDSAREEQKAIARRNEYLESTKILNKHLGSLVGKYNLLQAEYKGLNTEAEKAKWIKSHKTDFDNLGISVNNVKTADDAFISNTQDFINAIKKRAKAMAAADKLQKAYEERLSSSENWKKTGDKIHRNDVSTLKLTKDDYYVGMAGGYYLRESGARKYNANIESGAKQTYEKEAEKLGKIIGENASQQIQNGTTNNSGGGTSFTAKGLNSGDRKEHGDFAQIGSVKYLKDMQSELQSQLDLLTPMDVRYSTISNKLKEINKQLEKAQEYQDLWTGKADTTKEVFADLRKSLKASAKSFDAGMPNDYEEQLEAIAKKGDDLNSVCDSISKLSSAFGQLGSAIGGTEGAWLSWAGTTLSTLAQTSAQIGSMIMQEQVLATAKATEAGAGLPFPMNLAAIAAGVAAVVSIFASLPTFAEGGIIGGTSIGDYNLARVNNGEMILNGHQQENLFNILNGGRLSDNTLSGGDVHFKIKGEDLIGTLSNYNKKRSRV